MVSHLLVDKMPSTWESLAREAAQQTALGSLARVLEGWFAVCRAQQYSQSGMANCSFDCNEFSQPGVAQGYRIGFNY